ncbi:MAG: hypothetical protein PVH73_04170 [Candidatus Bathyarchaeota archaeon]|jgi:hypothetical protein
MRLPKELALTVFFILLYSINVAYAIPSGGVYPPEFYYRNGDWYDSWGYNRNYFAGEDGFLPNVAYESIGFDKELAYEIGEWFEDNYDNSLERAEAILDYVQKWTEYGYDDENVFRNGIPQEEWAWNADEMAHMFNETTNSVAIGDCEDMSFLGATIYLAAKFDVALVDAPEHVAFLIWLPEYDNANYYWDIVDDGRDYGWIWVETTSEVNPLGWTPPDFSDGDWDTYILGFSKFSVEYSPRNPKAEDDVTVRATVESAISTVNTVILNYDTGSNSEEIQMIKKGSYYEGVIPKQPVGTRVTCNVHAIDHEELTAEKNFEYVVGEEFQFPPFFIEAGIIFLVVFVLIVVLALANR